MSKNTQAAPSDEAALAEQPTWAQRLNYLEKVSEALKTLATSGDGTSTDESPAPGKAGARRRAKDPKAKGGAGDEQSFSLLAEELDDVRGRIAALVWPGP